MPKTEVVAVATGRGSRRFNKDIAVRTTGVLCGGKPLHPRDSVQYLGLQLSVTGRSGVTVDARISKANTAHARLAPKVFRKGFLPAALRVRLWISLVRTIALHGLEVCILSDGALTELERWQSTKLRSVTKTPVHLTHLTN
eukprot:4105564-Pyramimonas_sp.AAC.1